MKPDENTSLEDMIEVGLPLHLQALEEIGVAATKEYALEKNLKKMKDEWQDMEFELNLYRYFLAFIPVLLPWTMKIVVSTNIVLQGFWSIHLICC